MGTDDMKGDATSMRARYDELRNMGSNRSESEQLEFDRLRPQFE